MQQGFFRASSSPSKQGVQLSLSLSSWKHTFSFLASSLYGPLVSILAFASLSTSAAYPDSGLETDMAHIRNELGTMSQSLSGLRQDVQSQTLWVEAISQKMDTVEDALYGMDLSLDQIEVSSSSQVSILDDIRRYERLNGADLDVIRSGVENVASNTAALHYLPNSVSNAISLGFSKFKIWEPYEPWTNFYSSGFPAFNANITNFFLPTENTYYIDPDLNKQGFVFWDYKYGDTDYVVPGFVEFLSLTMGQNFDPATYWAGVGRKQAWEDAFGGSDLSDAPMGEADGLFAFWVPWQAEAWRRQLKRLDGVTNRLASVSNVVSSLRDYFVTNDALATSPLVSSDVSNAVLNAGEYLPSTEDYYTEEQAETNSWLSLDFVASVDAAEPTVNQSSISDTTVSGKLDANNVWTADGFGLFRLTNPMFQAGLRQITGVQNCPDGTIEKDVGQDFQILAWIGSSLTNFYDLFYYLFCLFCIYREVRFYTSDGRVQ